MEAVQADKKKVADFLLEKLSRILLPDDYSKLKYMLDELRSRESAQSIYIAFSKVVRSFGKAPVNYSKHELEQSDEIRNHWSPPTGIDKAIRLLILLEIPDKNETAYINTLENLFSAGDVGELVALYSSLPVLPNPEKLITRCTEGIRTNMGEVFEAVANNNPFPADYLSKDAFNQMVLKCLFVGKPLYKIVNLQSRINSKLAQMAADYAHERWAASRKVNPELWQLIAPPDLRHLNDIMRLAESDDLLENKAATIVTSISELHEIQKLFNESTYMEDVKNGQLTWKSLGEEVWK